MNCKGRVCGERLKGYVGEVPGEVWVNLTLLIKVHDSDYGSEVPKGYGLLETKDLISCIRCP